MCIVHPVSPSARCAWHQGLHCQLHPALPSQRVVLHITSLAMLFAFFEQAHPFPEAQPWRSCAVCRLSACGPILARHLPLRLRRSGRNAPPVPLLLIPSLGRAMAILLACRCKACKAQNLIKTAMLSATPHCQHAHLTASQCLKPAEGVGLSLPAVAPICDEGASLGAHERTSARAQLPVSPT